MTPEENPEVRLIRRASRGDAEAFATLFQRHFQPVYNYALSLCGDQALAEDLTQETFIRAHVNLGTLGPPWNLRAWLFRLTHNLFVDETRRRGAESLEESFFTPTGGPDPERETILKEVAERVGKALRSLPPQQREILVLRELHDFPYAEIAEIMDISHANVKVLLHRARASFQEAYGIRLIMEEPTPDCPQVSRLLHDLHDGEPLEDQERLVRAHLRECQACQERRRWLVTQSVLLGALVPVVPSPALGQRILGEIGLPGRGPGDGRPRSRPRLRTLALGGGGAALLLATGWGLYAVFGGGALPGAAGTPLPSQETQAPAALPESPSATFTPPATIFSTHLSPTPSPPPTDTPTAAQPPPTATHTSPPPPTATSPPADTSPPKVGNIDASPNPTLTTVPVTISASVNDPSGVTGVTLYYRTGKNAYTKAGSMQPSGGGHYSLTIGPLTPAGVYDFRIRAVDGLGNATCGVENLPACPGGTFQVNIP